MQNSILFKLLSGMFEVQTNFRNSTFPVQIAVVLMIRGML